MINTMMGSPEMQPLMTVLGRTARGHPGLSARRKNRPNRNRVERLPTRHLVERFYAQRHAHPSIGRCGPSFGTHGQDDCPRCPRHVAAAGQDHLALITRYDHRLVGARSDSAMPSLARPWRAFMIDCVWAVAVAGGPSLVAGAGAL